MAWSYTNRHQEATNLDNNGSATLNSTVAGNLIIAAAVGWSSNNDTSSVSFSDGVNGTYSSALYVENGQLWAAVGYIRNNGGGNLTVTVSSNGSSDNDIMLSISEFSGGDTSSPLSGTPATNTGNGTSCSSGSFTPPDNNVLLIAVVGHDGTPTVTITENAGSEGFTLVAENETVYEVASIVYKIISGSPGSVSHSWTAGFSAAWCAGIAAFKERTATLEQEGFRWRNDDGSESGATWAANQDTNITEQVSTARRLRVLINATEDPPSEPYLLQYKKSTDTDWKTVH